MCSTPALSNLTFLLSCHDWRFMQHCNTQIVACDADKVLTTSEPMCADAPSASLAPSRERNNEVQYFCCVITSMYNLTGMQSVQATFQSLPDSLALNFACGLLCLTLQPCGHCQFVCHTEQLQMLRFAQTTPAQTT